MNGSLKSIVGIYGEFTNSLIFAKKILNLPNEKVENLNLKGKECIIGLVNTKSK